MVVRFSTCSLVLAVALLAVLGNAARAADLDPPTVKGNVSIQFPKGWGVSGMGTAIVGAVAPKADKDTTGQYKASLSVTVDVGNKVDGSAQQTILQQQIPGYRVIEPPTPIKIAGVQGVVFGGSFKRNNVELRTRLYMVAVNNQIYTITFTCLNSKWKDYEADMQASIDTFAVKKGP